MFKKRNHKIVYHRLLPPSIHIESVEDVDLTIRRWLQDKDFVKETVKSNPIWVRHDDSVWGFDYRIDNKEVIIEAFMIADNDITTFPDKFYLNELDLLCNQICQRLI